SAFIASALHEPVLETEVIGDSNDRFPLTPALSLGEREILSAVVALRHRFMVRKSPSPRALVLGAWSFSGSWMLGVGDFLRRDPFVRTGNPRSTPGTDHPLPSYRGPL